MKHFVRNNLPQLLTTHTEQKVREAGRCTKLIENGKAVCGVKLDCHLHDWRQEDMKEQWMREVVERMKMEGEMGKLTPFQQTVNTYIENRGEEIIKNLT